MSDAYCSNVYYEMGWNNLQMGEVISCLNIYTWAVELGIYEGRPILKYHDDASKKRIAVNMTPISQLRDATVHLLYGITECYTSDTASLAWSLVFVNWKNTVKQPSAIARESQYTPPTRHKWTSPAN